MASTTGNIVVFILTMAVVFVVFFFAGRWGLFSPLEGSPFCFYGAIIFCSLAVTFGVNMYLKEALLGEKED